MIAINQTWQRGNEYFTIERIEGNKANLTGNSKFLNPNGGASITIDVELLISFLQRDHLKDFILVRG